MTKNNIEKSTSLFMQLNSIDDYTPDFTLKKAKFIVLDLEVSGNKQRLDEKALTEALPTLRNKPIKVKYFPVSDVGEEDDHFGDHEEKLAVDRDGNEYINTETESIGHFISDGYYEEIDGKTVVCADGVLYAEEARDQIALIQEWMDNGIKVNMSCEYLYKNYQIQDGVEIIYAPIVFTGMAFLNSEPRGDSKVILGAYDSATILSMNQKKQWNESLNKLLCSKVISDDNKSLNNIEENTNETEDVGVDYFKKMCQLSHDDIRSKIYQALEKVVTADEYWNMWIYDVYDDKFILQSWDNESESYKYYEVMYTKTDAEVEVNYETKQEVVRDWTSVMNQLETATTELESSKNELVTVQSELEKVNETVVSLNQEVETLTATVTELKEYEESFNAQKLEKSLNARKEEFEVKFKKVNALEQFESEEVQTLIAESLENTEALVSLNQMIIDLMPDVNELVSKSMNANKDSLVELASNKMDNLNTKGSSFEDRYMK